MTYSVEQIVFWACALLLAYTYVGYPLLVYAASLIFSKPVKKAAIEPSVTVLITAYNEQSAIRAKIENTLRIDYPKDKLEILVASDGSTDRTDDIVREFAGEGVRLVRKEGRVGKTETQNAAVEQASGEIVLFSDATTAYLPDVLRNVIPSFADDTVGCVAGRLVYVDDASTNVGKGAQSYWGYETFIKMAESRACSLIGASGCLYAVRKDAYEPLYPEACSDFLICTSVFRRGLRSVFEPLAVCTEQTNRDAGHELRMRVRVISQTFTDLWRNRDMMNPFRSGFFAVELISHKLLRYAVPFVLLVAYAACAVLAAQSPFYVLIFALQTGFYVSALLGWLIERSGRKSSLLAMPLYFTLANLASVLAFYKFLKGEKYARWEPIREVR